MKLPSWLQDLKRAETREENSAVPDKYWIVSHDQMKCLINSFELVIPTLSAEVILCVSFHGPGVCDIY